MAVAAAIQSSGKVVVRNIGLLLSGDIDRPILDADTIVIDATNADDVVVCLRSAGDKATDWQKTNNQYFIIGWRCRKK